MLRLRLLPVLVAFVLLPLSCFSQAPGSLDSSFGIGGEVITDFDRSGAVFGVALQSDGKVVAAGYSRNATFDRDFTLVRYQADGTLDSSFGTGGKVTTPIGSGNDAAHCVAVQSDGKIVAAGYSYSSGDGGGFALVRYQADGTLDSGFGTGGKVTTSFSPYIDEAHSMALQSDGKIVVAGSTGPGPNDFALARYNADGTLDSSFGTGGKVITDFGGSVERWDAAHSVALQSDGKIVVTGYSGPLEGDGFARDVALARYHTDGTLDSGFGTGGKVLTDFGGGTDVARSMALQSDGKIVVAGFSTNGSNPAFGLARLTDSGTLDSTFGTRGKVITNFASGGLAFSVAVQSDGNILAAGFSDGTALARYQADGTLDTSFGTGGKVTTGPNISRNENAMSIALQSDGKIVVAADYAGDFAVLRYTAAPLDAPVFDSVTGLPDEPAGTSFLGFGAPVVDDGAVAGVATIKPPGGGPQTVIFGGDGSVLARTGGPDPQGQTFVQLGDPVFGGEALGFAGVAQQITSSLSPLLRADGQLGTERLFAVRPGGRLAALYSQLTKVAGLKRLAAQADPAPGGGQFAKFGGFGLPRTRGGLIYAANLHRSDGVTKDDDFGVWREKASGGDSDLLLRTGKPVAGHTPTKLVLMTPVPGATDQRRSFAPDGGVAAMAKFDDGKTGVVTVAADGSEAVPLESESDVPDEAGNAVANVRFESFSPPATASGGKIALLAALRAAALGLPSPPREAIFSNRDGTMSRVMARGDDVPVRPGVRFGQLGQPAMGRTGMIGLVAALTGQGVTPTTRKAIARVDGGVKTVVARLGDPAPGYNTGVVFRRFMSMVVTDSDPARIVFTATVGGPGMNGTNNVGLWSAAATGTALVMRKGGPIEVNGQTLTVRVFEALQAPAKSRGQGRSTDARGFVTAKVKLSDGRQGVLRIPLP